MLIAHYRRRWSSIRYNLNVNKEPGMFYFIRFSFRIPKKLFCKFAMGQKTLVVSFIVNFCGWRRAEQEECGHWLVVTSCY